MNTSISAFPTPTSTKAIHSTSVGSRVIAIAATPSVINEAATSAPSGNRVSRGVPNAITSTATIDRRASSNPVSP